MDATANYPIVVMPLTDQDGGGFVARVPDLPGCYGDGDTPDAAVRDAQKAIVEWVDEYSKMGRAVPRPGSMAADMRQRREDELRFLAECVCRLRDSEKAWDNLDDRIAAIESELRYLVDMVENSAGWERFHIITKSTRKPQPELLC